MGTSLDLVLDTSRQGIALGIYDSAKPVYESFAGDCRGENLGKALDQALESAKVSLESIRRVLVTLGPGSFTGLRTGIAFCEGLCFSGARSLHGVSTLCALRTLSSDASAVSILYARTGFLYVGMPDEELFISVEEAVEKFVQNNFRSFVVDKRSAEIPQLQDFFAHKGIEPIVSDGSEIASFCKFFEEIEPSLVQKANYIQPSYYERKGAAGVQ